MYPMGECEKFTFRLSYDLLQKVDELAKLEESTRNEVIRTAVRDFVYKHVDGLSERLNEK